MRAGQKESDDQTPLWSLQMMDHGGQSVAYLRMASWVAYKTRWDWRGFLHATMRNLALRGTPALIIDLRGNEGGNDCGDEILAHLVDAPIPSRTTVRRVRFETVPAELRPFLDTWDDSFFTLGKGSIPIGGGWRDLLPEGGDGDGGLIAPAAPRFRGKVVVLTDAANSSATFQFAMKVQELGLAVLVGAPTGGSRRGINGGAFFFARLPRTQIEVDVPLIATFPPGPIADATRAPDQGVMPDVRIERTVADIASGRDPALDAALEVAIGTQAR